jgi:hypothetical protein
VTWLAVDPDVTSALLDDPEDHREAEPGPLALLFRGEKWFEDPRLRFLVHPHPGVTDSQFDVGAGRKAVVRVGIVVIELDVCRLDGQLAALGHCVARVDCKVHDDLLNLPRIGLDAPEIARREDSQLDVGSE